jgi:hypothetical protein
MKTSRKNSKMRSRNLKKAAKRLAAYSAAAAVTVVATNNTANAAEVVWDLPHDKTSYENYYGTFFNVTNGATSRAVYGYYYGTQGNFRLSPKYAGYLYGPNYVRCPDDPNMSLAECNVANYPSQAGAIGFRGSYPEFDPNNVGTGPGQNGDAYALPIDPSDPQAVGPADSFAVERGSAFQYGANYWAFLDGLSDGQTAFYGFRFNLGADTHYGWAQIRRHTDVAFTLSGFGYNNSPDTPSNFTGVDTVDIAGDFNGNGDVDPNDYLTLQAAWGVDDAGDIDLNGDTDINDFTLFQSSFRLENPGVAFSTLVAAAAAIPEPSSILLLAAGAAGLGAWRKRRAS